MRSIQRTPDILIIQQIIIIVRFLRQGSSRTRIYYDDERINNWSSLPRYYAELNLQLIVQRFVSRNTLVSAFQQGLLSKYPEIILLVGEEILRSAKRYSHRLRPLLECYYNQALLNDALIPPNFTPNNKVFEESEDSDESDDTNNDKNNVAKVVQNNSVQNPIPSTSYVHDINTNMERIDKNQVGLPKHPVIPIIYKGYVEAPYPTSSDESDDELTNVNRSAAIQTTLINEAGPSNRSFTPIVHEECIPPQQPVHAESDESEYESASNDRASLDPLYDESEYEISNRDRSSPLTISDVEGLQSGGILTRSGARKLHSIPNESSNVYLHEDDDIQPPGNRFLILSENIKKYRKFKIHGRECVMKIVQPPENVNSVEWLQGSLRDVMTYITSSCMPHDHVGFTINYDRLNTGPVWTRFQRANSYSVNDLWHIMTGIAQSANGPEFDESFIVTSATVEGISGSGRTKLTHESVFKRAVLEITNTDNLCLPRSLVVAHLNAERGEIRVGELQRKWKALTHRSRNTQQQEAIKLVHLCNVQIPSDGCGIHELSIFQEYYKRISVAIVVYEFLSFGKGGQPVFDGRNLVKNSTGKIIHTLYLLYYERSQHYQPILNINAALGGVGFCTDCSCSYNNNIEHRCSKKCQRCKNTPICNYVSRKVCKNCNRWFSNSQCLENHLKKGSAGYRGKGKKEMSVCDAMKLCKKCSKLVITTRKNHTCYEMYCQTCMCKRPFNHLCYMAPLKLKRHTKTVFLFYDFETQQTVSVKGDSRIKLHIPNLCVVQKVCSYCHLDVDVSNNCVHCGQREFVFENNPVGEFVDLALQKYANFAKTVCIAHNARSFDAQFILRFMIDKKKAQLPTIILNGTKIIVMKIGNTIFLDSLNYFHMPLSALPKAFGFANEIGKGSFPHLFNTPDNVNYIGIMPAINYYSPETMNVKDRNNFMEWYNKMCEENYVFNFNREIIEYCRTDVIILRRSCMMFRDLFIKTGNVCPFTECSTIASSCSKIFRRNYLKRDMISILPPKGMYRWKSTQSKNAIKWLILEEQKINSQMIHAAHSKEFRLPCGIAVDGYYEDQETGEKTVFQFHGYFWHGCRSCFLINRDAKLIMGDSMDERYENTQMISEKIKSLGYVLVEEWECVFLEKLKNNPENQAYLKEHPLLCNTPLDPRDAFYGGRTENHVTLYDIGENEKIKYVDVISLYPYICKTGKFPIGHPKIFVGDECKNIIGENNNLSDVEGLIKCSVLAPQNLFHPVLPYRSHGRLVFALCRTCCESLHQDDCVHRDIKDREFTGTWVVDEVKKAISKGYIVVKVYEIWQYEISQYDSSTGVKGLFTGYIDTFLKIKQEASGWPRECINNTAAQNDYITSYEKAEGIKLDREKIELNPALRALAKSALVCFWGKFGQRENLLQCEIVTTRQRLMEMLTDPQIEITGILPVNDDVMYVSFLYSNHAIKPSPTANVVIAAYTTAQARLKLYSYLEKLGHRMLYCDTDSCIYVSISNEYEPPIGNFLGDLTDELEAYGDGSYISSFVSGGPKFYAFIIQKPDGSSAEICKIKGITLNYKNSKHLNYNAIRSFVTGERTDPIIINFDAIRRTAFHRVVTQPESKSTYPQNKKRRIDGTYATLPFGYKKY